MAKNILFSLQKRLFRFLNREFYFSPQKYRAKVLLSLENRSQKTKTVCVVFPIPPQTPNQKFSNLSFSLDGQIKKEKKYQNSYFSTNLNIKPQEKKQIEQSFTAAVSPVIYKHLPPLKKGEGRENRFIPADKKINKLKKKILKDKSKESVRAIYQYVRDSLSYGNPIRGLYTAHDALEKDTVDCGGFVTLFCSLLGSIDVACYPVFGFLAGYKKNSLHAWAEAIDSQGQSVPFDPSSDNLWKKGRSFKSGGFGWVGSDRITLSRGCDFKIKLDDKLIRVDILQYPIVIPKDKEIKVAVLFKTKRI